MPEPTATAARLLATPAAFRAWLAGKPGHERLRQSWEVLQEFVYDVTDQDASIFPLLSGSYVTVDGGRENRLPAWVESWGTAHDYSEAWVEVNADERYLPVAASLHALDRATATDRAQPGQGAQQATEEG